MTITDLMSVRLGIVGSLLGGTHEIHETIEQVCGIVRAGCGLRMVLHGECRNINALQAFNHVVIQIDVADEHLAVLPFSNGASTVSPIGASTAKPWLCAVISILPVVISLTG